MFSKVFIRVERYRGQAIAESSSYQERRLRALEPAGSAWCAHGENSQLIVTANGSFPLTQSRYLEADANSPELTRS